MSITPESRLVIARETSEIWIEYTLLNLVKVTMPIHYKQPNNANELQPLKRWSDQEVLRAWCYRRLSSGRGVTCYRLHNIKIFYCKNLGVGWNFIGSHQVWAIVANPQHTRVIETHETLEGQVLSNDVSFFCSLRFKLYKRTESQNDNKSHRKIFKLGRAGGCLEWVCIQDPVFMAKCLQNIKLWACNRTDKFELREYKEG